MISKRKLRLPLLIAGSLILSGCILGGSDRDSDRESSRGSSDKPPGEQPEDVFQDTDLHSFSTPGIIDLEGVENDRISALIVNFTIPEELEDDDDDDPYDNVFNLNADQWSESEQKWSLNEIAPNEDDQAGRERYYYLLDSNGWQEVVDSTNRTLYSMLDENIVEEHLGVQRQWVIDGFEFDVEGKPFNGEIGGIKIIDWQALIISFGLTDYAKNFDWAVDNEDIDKLKFSKATETADEAKVFVVTKKIDAVRYQVDQQLQGHYQYTPVATGISAYSQLNSGSFVDNHNRLSLTFSFTMAPAADTPCGSNDPAGEELGMVELSSLADGNNKLATITRECIGSETILMMNFSQTQKLLAGMDGTYDLFLSKPVGIDASNLIYVGKRYNKYNKNSDNKPGMQIPEIYYNDTAIEDLKSAFKTWRDQEHLDAL